MEAQEPLLDSPRESTEHHRHAEQIEHMEPLAVGDQRLQRRIGWVTGAAVNISYMIGSGIFVGPSFTMKLVGSGLMNVFIWFLGGVLSMAGAWTFAELGTMLPRSGGEVGYLEYIYRRPKYLLAFLFTMWSLSNRASGVSSQGTVFGSYMNYAFFGSEYKSDWMERGWSVACATILTLVNILSSKASLRVMTCLTVVKLAILGLVLFVGVLSAMGFLPGDADMGSALSFQGTATSIAPYASAIYYVQSSYSGWQNLNYIMDEVKDPIKSLPKALAASLLSTTVLYVLTNIAYLVVLGQGVMETNMIVAAAFFTKSLGENFASTVLPIFIGLSSFGSGAAMNFSAGRLIMEASRAGLFPFGRTFGHVDPRVQSPVNAYLLQYALTILYTLIMPRGAVYQFYIAFTGYPHYAFYFLTVVGVLVLRKREPHNARPVVAPYACIAAFLCFTLYALLFVYIPVDSPHYPYWAPYVTAIFYMVACSGLWYYLIIVKDTPGKSYNTEIRKRGQVALDEEVFGEVETLDEEHERIP
ncbi:amino acid transporter [Lichtheimia hyalospora FSU 10163]|nr:amino acid transporter [Lichtheimia hyalospora FSU 10163]